MASHWIKNPADYPERRPPDLAGPPLAVNLVRLGMSREELRHIGPALYNLGIRKPSAYGFIADRRIRPSLQVGSAMPSNAARVGARSRG